MRLVTRKRREHARDEPAGQPRLTIGRAEIEEDLEARVALGQEIAEREIGSREDLEATQADFYIWDEYNTTLLKQRFTATEIADDYAWWPGNRRCLRDLQEKIADLRRDVKRKIRKLISVKERLPPYEEPSALPLH
jgi:hypothetical protein